MATVIVVDAGINGLAAGIELRKCGHKIIFEFAA